MSSSNPENQPESSPQVWRGIRDIAGIFVGFGVVEYGSGLIAKSVGAVIVGLAGVDFYRMAQQEMAGQQGSDTVE